MNGCALQITTLGRTGSLVKSTTRQGRRSAFRAEFYNDASAENKSRAAVVRAAEAKRRRRKASIFVPLVGLLFLLCVIAVLGSSAMIWLRKLATLFGVEFSGDS